MIVTPSGSARFLWFTIEEGSVMERTLHVYPSDDGWVVRKDGKTAELFTTQREAVNAARQIVKDKAAGQLVVHGKDGRIREHESHGMTAIQDPPKRSRLAKRIKQAVGTVALNRVKADSTPPRASSSEK